VEEFLRVMRACSDRNRVLILKILQQGPRCVCEMQALLGVAQPTVSKHLRILEEAGLIFHRKEGLWVEYALTSGERSPYAAALLGNLRHWLEEDSRWTEIRDRLKGIDRYEACQVLKTGKRGGEGKCRR